MSQSTNNEQNTSAAIFGSFADQYEKGTGGATRYIAKRLIDLSPPFTKDSIILDNACGTGIVTDEILDKLKTQSSESPPPSITVYAADPAGPMTNIFTSKVKHLKENDPTTAKLLAAITIKNVRAEDLTADIVPSNAITHSYTNFGLFFCADPLAAAQHIYRTLAPGGTAFITTWADLGYMDPMRKAESLLNPMNGNFEMPFGTSWEEPSYIKSLLGEAGFDESKIEVTREESFFRARDVGELAMFHTELFSLLIRKGKWESDEKKAEWREKLEGFLAEDGHFVEKYKGGGVATRMVANVAVCQK